MQSCWYLKRTGRGAILSFFYPLSLYILKEPQKKSEKVLPVKILLPNNVAQRECVWLVCLCVCLLVCLYEGPRDRRIKLAKRNEYI